MRARRRCSGTVKRDRDSQVRHHSLEKLEAIASVQTPTSALLHQAVSRRRATLTRITEAKELKQLVRNVISPTKDLGHSDKPVTMPRSKNVVDATDTVDGPVNTMDDKVLPLFPPVLPKNVSTDGDVRMSGCNLLTSPASQQYNNGKRQEE